ncbi:MAG: sensor histidine kinase [Kineosporiaceae bacterium]
MRLRLAVLGTALATGTLLLFSVLLVALAVAGAPAQQDEALDALAGRAARDYRPGGAEPAIVVDPGRSLEEFVLVTDAAGEVVYAEARVDGVVPPVPPTLVEAALDSGTARATVTVDGVGLRLVGRALPGEEPGEKPGVLVAGQATAARSPQNTGLLTAVVVAAVVTAVAGAVASRVVSGRALRPLRDLARTTGEIARTGDVTRRLPTGRRRDEVAVLAGGFNAMMTRLEGAQTDLAATLDTQRRFLADASHELRTPLATVRSNAGFLVDRPHAAPEDRDDALRDLRDEADRMSLLVDGLLALARSDAAPPPAPEPVDLAAVARDVCRLTGARWHPADGPPWVAGGTVVRGDEAALNRMLRCLVDNGIVHGGGEVGVRVGRVSATWVLATVWDGGPGFRTESLPFVFDRFHRGGDARTRPGSGLGLAIARSVARRHGGDVHAANGRERGAVLDVRLPAVS